MSERVTIGHQFLDCHFFIPTWPVKHLFLGTFNPVGGKEVNYFYGRKRNRTWKLISKLFATQLCPTADDFFQLLKKHEIACMDMIRSVDAPKDKVPLITGKGYGDSAIINGYVNREYNTGSILQVIKKNPGVRVYSTWGNGPSLENWKEEVVQIEGVINLSSPSPRTRIKFDVLLSDWQQHIPTSRSVAGICA